MISSTLLFLGGIGGPEIFLILGIVILLFGAKKIPELARGMGKGIREFKDCLLYTSPSPRDAHESRMPSSA